MDWRRPGEEPLSETMMISLMTHICVTQPQWVKIQVNEPMEMHYGHGTLAGLPKFAQNVRFLTHARWIMKSNLWAQPVANILPVSVSYRMQYRIVWRRDIYLTAMQLRSALSKQVLRAGTSNYIPPTVSVGCNYLFLPLIPAMAQHPWIMMWIIKATKYDPQNYCFFFFHYLMI